MPLNLSAWQDLLQSLSIVGTRYQCYTAKIVNTRLTAKLIQLIYDLLCSRNRDNTGFIFEPTAIPPHPP